MMKNIVRTKMEMRKKAQKGQRRLKGKLASKILSRRKRILDKKSRKFETASRRERLVIDVNLNVVVCDK